MIGFRITPQSAKRLERLLAVSLLLLVGIILFRGISSHSISQGSDEVIHIRVTQEMWQSGDVLTPTHGGVPYFQKPPFKFWLTLIPLAIFGESNFSYRFFDAAAGVGTIALVLSISTSLTGSFLVGFIASFILLGSSQLISGPHGFTFGVQDGMLVFLNTAALALILHAGKLNAPNAPKQNSILLGIVIACGILTKSAVGLLPLIVLALEQSYRILFLKRPVAECWKQSRWAVCLALLIPALYFIPHSLLSHDAFRKFFVGEVFSRLTLETSNKAEDYYYLRLLFQRGVLVDPLLLGTALITSISFFRRPSERMLLWFGLLPLAIFSFSQSRQAWYLFPSYPALALIVALFIQRCLSRLLELRAPRESITFFQLLSSLTLGAVGLFGTYLVVEDGAITLKELAQQAEKRLKIDKVVEEINRSFARSKDQSVLLIDEAIPLAANPKRGKFNVEGIYLKMLGERLVLANSTDQDFRNKLAQASFVIYPADKSSLIPPEGSSNALQVTIPKYATRTAPVEIRSRVPLPQNEAR